VAAVLGRHVRRQAYEHTSTTGCARANATVMRCAPHALSVEMIRVAFAYNHVLFEMGISCTLRDGVRSRWVFPELTLL
jgi:hypothetical protein